MRFDLIKLFLVCSAVFAIIGTFAIAAQAEVIQHFLYTIVLMKRYCRRWH